MDKDAANMFLPDVHHDFKRASKNFPQRKKNTNYPKPISQQPITE